MFNKNEVPSVNTLGRVVLYFAVAVALGMSFSLSLELLNKAFLLGAGLTLGNVLLSLLFVRHVAATHFTD